MARDQSAQVGTAASPPPLERGGLVCYAMYTYIVCTARAGVGNGNHDRTPVSQVRLALDLSRAGLGLSNKTPPLRPFREA